MLYLIIVSLIWAFSFGLIKGNLTGLNPFFVGFARMCLSFFVFAGFLKVRRIPFSLAWKLTAVGAVQFGVMYVAYIYSYRYAQAHQIAMFTIFTPLYVTLFSDMLARRFRWAFFVSAIIATIGAGVVKWSRLEGWDFWAGFALVQVSNICFGLGQILYRRMDVRRCGLSDKDVFGYMYAGGVLATGAAMLTVIGLGQWSFTLEMTSKQAWTLVYLGILASGICFFMWNYGARKTSSGMLAVMNNFKIPLAVAVSMVFFGEKTDVLRLVIGGGIVLAALEINRRFA